MEVADFVIIGAGIAGLSAGARLARHGRVLLVDGEAALGVHSSGRSATFSHFGIGNRLVRGLTFRSRATFLDHPELARTSPALFIATREMVPALRRLEADMAPFAPRLERCSPERMAQLFPPLRLGQDAVVDGVLDPDGLRLDSDRLLQNLAVEIKAAGGEVRLADRVESAKRVGDEWRIHLESGAVLASPLLIDAAGAWADAVATMCGAVPLGLKPLRRTMIVVDPPAGQDPAAWPFVKTVVDDFYILPESGRLMASPVDEVESDPCDAQPEEYDVALAAWKVETYTHLPVKRIAHRWAGLRTFTADRTPAVGFDPDVPGFFWLAGQGGFGLQTAPAMAEIAEALLTGAPWPAWLAPLGTRPEDLAPERFRGP